MKKMKTKKKRPIYNVERTKLYKNLKLKLSMTELELMEENHKRLEAQREKEFYETRFMKLGSNVITRDGVGQLVTNEWEINPEPYGLYQLVDHGKIKTKEIKDELVKKLAKEMARCLIEQNLAQIIIHDKEDTGPFDEYSTVAIKLTVVPWEQMPHKKTIKIIEPADEYQEY